MLRLADMNAALKIKLLELDEFKAQQKSHRQQVILSLKGNNTDARHFRSHATLGPSV